MEGFGSLRHILAVALPPWPVLRGPRGLRGLYLTKNFYECETPDNWFRKSTDRELTP
jgi:hypothetical protein